MPNREFAVDDIDVNSPEFAAFERFATLTSRKKALVDETKDVEAALKAMEPRLLAYFGESGLELVRVAGFTISPHREPWVKPKLGLSRGDVCRALEDCDMKHFVLEPQFNVKGLTSHIKALEKRHNALADQGGLDLILPPQLLAVIELKPAYRIDARRKSE